MMLTEEASKFTIFTNGASDVEITRKIHSLGYNAVADNASLSSFVQLLLPPKSAKSRIISENLNL